MLLEAYSDRVMLDIG